MDADRTCCRCGADTGESNFCGNCGARSAPLHSGHWTPGVRTVLIAGGLALIALALFRIELRLSWLVVGVATVGVLGVLLWAPTWDDKDSRASIGTALATGAVISGMFFLLTVRDEHNRKVLETRDQQAQARIANQEALALQLTLQHDLSGVDLSNDRLGRFDLANKNLTGANLYGVTLAHGRLIGSVLDGVSLNRADLEHALMRKAKLNGASVNGADLDWVNLNEAQLRGASLGMYLQGRTEHFTGLYGAQLIDGNLQGACLAHADLRRARLGGANLANADLAYADLTGVNFVNDGVGADLKGTSFWRANLSPGARAYVLRAAPQDLRPPRGSLRNVPIPRTAHRARVVQVYNGNTIKVTPTSRRRCATCITPQDPGWVRLIGLNAPNLDDRRADPNPEHRVGQQAAQLVQALTPARSAVWYVLGRKQRERKPENTGRWLAYIWLGNGRFLNERILESGYALRETDQGERSPYASVFDTAQLDAKRTGKGLWGICPEYSANGG
jgi:uncharacterized protein YjbI with pentapeptide repeats/endonuclease YncB( thermonuclease family)